MVKLIAGVIAGVFVGAVVFEIINRSQPHALRNVEEKARRTAGRAIDAFKEGYRRPRSKATAQRLRAR